MPSQRLATFCAVPDVSSPAAPATVPSPTCATRFGVFPECPLCGGGLHPEHAHFKCRACGWRDSCCD